MDACRAHAARLPAFFPDGIAPESVLRDESSRGEGDEKTNDADDAESLTDAPRLEVEDGPFGFRAFLAAASLVASRAFHVDDAHGQGLVPSPPPPSTTPGGGESTCTSRARETRATFVTRFATMTRTRVSPRATTRASRRRCDD